MELSDDNLKAMTGYLQQSISPDPNVRWPAEKFLRSVESVQNYSILLLHLVNRPDLDMTIRVAGAITFKNFVKKNWASDAESDSSKIADQDREGIKRMIIDCMLVAPGLVQKQLSDAVSIIGKHDFPARWPTLLTYMVDKFATGDFNVINGVLHTAHSIFRRYRHEFKSNELWTEIKFVLDTFAKPLTDLFVATHELTKAHSSNPEALKIIYSSLLLIAKIFYSLNFQDLPEFFEDNMPTWMPLFHTLLTTHVKSLETDSEDEPGLMEQLKSQVCFNVQLYAQMYDEEFQPYLPDFVKVIWDLLTNTGLQAKYDLLVSHALQFLCTVSGKVQYKNLFEAPDTLNQICQNVIIPNIQFRESDLELFEDNPEEYMKRDLEGSDMETRRRAACDLVKALAAQFEQTITTLFSQFVQVMLSDYCGDPGTKWKQKNAAVYLVISLAGKGSTQRHGVTQTSTLVNINDFANNYVLPELNKPVDSLPVVKADSIKFVLMFRGVLPPSVVTAALPLIVRHLRSPNHVVHSYAASALDRILLVRTPANTPLITGESLSPIAGELLNNLFHVLTLKGSEENEYVMKAIMRSFSVLEGGVVPYLAELLPRLSEKLAMVAKNPNKPQFNHCLFETITLSIGIVCKKTPEAVTSFEEVLFPIFQVILQQDVQDFMPYVFQVLSELLRLQRGEELPGPYLALYSCLLAPPLWERQGNVRPLAAFLRAVISKAQAPLYKTDINMEGLLGVFQKLIGSRLNDHEGFLLIRTIMAHAPREHLEPYLKQILLLMFQRVSSSKTQKFVKGLIVFFGYFCYAYGAQRFIDLVDEIQPQMFAMIMERLILMEAQKISGIVERKTAAFGFTKLLCEAKSLIDGPYSQHWAGLLRVCLGVLEGTGAEEDEEQTPTTILEQLEAHGYEAAFSQLAYASREHTDPFQGAGDPRLVLAEAVSKLSQSMPGRLAPLIAQSLTPSEQQTLTSYLQQASLSLS